jgi:hypothetical protein
MNTRQSAITQNPISKYLRRPRTGWAILWRVVFGLVLAWGLFSLLKNAHQIDAQRPPQPVGETASSDQPNSAVLTDLPWRPSLTDLTWASDQKVFLSERDGDWRGLRIVKGHALPSGLDAQPWQDRIERLQKHAVLQRTETLAVHFLDDGQVLVQARRMQDEYADRCLLAWWRPDVAAPVVWRYDAGSAASCGDLMALRPLSDTGPHKGAALPGTIVATI